LWNGARMRPFTRIAVRKKQIISRDKAIAIDTDPLGSQKKRRRNWLIQCHRDSDWVGRNLRRGATRHVTSTNARAPEVRGGTVVGSAGEPRAVNRATTSFLVPCSPLPLLELPEPFSAGSIRHRRRRSPRRAIAGTGGAWSAPPSRPPRRPPSRPGVPSPRYPWTGIWLFTPVIPWLGWVVGSANTAALSALAPLKNWCSARQSEV
jgi:hypothetical protein